MNFTLDIAEIVKLVEWLGTLPDATDLTRSISFTYIPGAIGTKVEVKDSVSGQIGDITLYENW